ncbi:MAG TPA: AmmeMemoRadiSam system protein B, partial [Spirochaetota bacterium]|nr:AmmeMemoRadiSam system protein B [Spirochaetota bacterium]
MKKFLNIIILISIIVSCNALDSSAKIKKSALSGSWFSSNPNELISQIDTFFGKSDIYKGKSPLVLILPHAGYAYSGKTAVDGYRFLGAPGKSTCEADLVLLIGPSHYAGFRGCMLLDVDYIETPLGKVKINREAVGRLSGDRLFRKDPAPFELEHSIEIHLPFLQRLFREKMAGDVQVLPILVGEIDDTEAVRAASA